MTAPTLCYGHVTFGLHSLLQECSWGIQQGLGIVTCNAEDLVVTDLVCFMKSFLQHFISEWLTAPTFRVCSPLMQVPYVPECPWEGLGNIRHLHKWGTSLEVGAIIRPVEYITPSFLTFFSVWGEHSVNHGWLCSGEDLCQTRGHRPLLRQSNMGLVQECAQWLSISTKQVYQRYSSGVMSLSRIISTQRIRGLWCLVRLLYTHVTTKACTTTAVMLEWNGQNCQQ